MPKFGLIGYPLEHSSSPAYFEAKFRKMNLADCSYELYPLFKVEKIQELFLHGYNVTIPYKESIMRMLDVIDPVAQEIGAVNTVVFKEIGWTGYNTDVVGVSHSLDLLLGDTRVKKALVFGTGGSSKAVVYELKRRNIKVTQVSRAPVKRQIGYEDITPETIKAHKLIVNTTPVGMHPNVNDHLPIPMENIGKRHFVLDLIYNPEETVLLKTAAAQRAKTMNGLEMLHRQADETWEIWKKTFNILG